MSVEDVPITVTSSGCRVKLIPSGTGAWLLIRDDGQPMFRAMRRSDVSGYLEALGYSLEPSPDGKELIF